MKFLAAAVLAGAFLASTPGIAADLFETAPPPLDAPQGQSELGTNWYIRGDVGYGITTQDSVAVYSGLFPTIGNQPIGDASTTLPPPRGNAVTSPGMVFSAGFGYRVNDWFRAEADWQFSKGPGTAYSSLMHGLTIYCPEVAQAVPVNGTSPVGYQYDYTTCNGNVNVTQYNNTVMGMGYIDLGHWGMFNPFIGAGAGINVNTITGKASYNQTDTGAIYTGSQISGSAPAIWVTPGQTGYVALPGASNPRGVPQGIGPANWSRNLASTKYTFAAAVAAGVGFQISQSATLDVTYRLLSLDITGGVKGLQQSLNLGVRYNLN